MSNVGTGREHISSAEIDAAVLARDGNICQMCGADANDLSGGRLSVCVFPPRAGLSSPNVVDLKTLCPDCKEGLATAKFLPRMDAQWLLVALRRAAGADQLAVLDWLLKKYPQRGGK